MGWGETKKRAGGGTARARLSGKDKQADSVGVWRGERWIVCGRDVCQPGATVIGNWITTEMEIKRLRVCVRVFVYACVRGN